MNCNGLRIINIDDAPDRAFHNNIIMIAKKTKTLLAAGAFAVALSAPAQANLKLSDFYIDLHEHSRSDSIYASNLGRDTMYVKVKVVEVLAPNTEREEIREVSDPKQLGLLVSPQRLVIKSGEEGRIRMVALNEPDEDRFYKITVVPVAGKLRNTQQIGVKILVGYSAWAYIRPKGQSPEISGRREGKKLILSNSGGTLAQMMAGKICPAEAACEKIEPFRVLAGQDKTIEVGHENAPVSFRMTWGNQGTDVSF